MLKVLDRTREDNIEAADDAGLTLDEVAREGARRMLEAALEAEVEHYIEGMPMRATRRADGSSFAMAVRSPER